MFGEGNPSSKQTTRKAVPKSYLPLAIKDGSGKTVAALISSNHPGTGENDMPEGEAWWYKICSIKPHYPGQSAYINIDGVDVYQWARLQYMDAWSQQSSVYFSCKDGTPDSSGQAYSEQEAFTLKCNNAMTGGVLYFNATHAPTKKLAFMTILGKGAQKDQLTVHVANGGDPGLLICAAWAHDLQRQTSGEGVYSPIEAKKREDLQDRMSGGDDDGDGDGGDDEE
jgi:hypothetical protein